MAKFLSDEYFSQVQAALSQDQKWLESTKSVKTTIAFNATDIGQNYVLTVENGVTTLLKAAAGRLWSSLSTEPTMPGPR